MEEIKEFEEGLSINWINKKSSECPSCQFRVIKGDFKSNRGGCPKCSYGDYCFNCFQKWRNDGFEKCGNPTCILINTILEDCKWDRYLELKKNGNTVIVGLPSLRVCPNSTCQTIISCTPGHKHMRCPQCNKGLCWVCLEIKNDKWLCVSWNDLCPKIAPTQQIWALPDSINYY